MTITMGFATVADSISNIAITGITVRDIDQIPDSAQMLTPILFPQPADFITDVNVERMSLGAGGTAKMDLTYTLNYVFLQAEIGSGLGAFAAYSNLIANIAAIVKAILSNDNITGQVDMTMQGIPSLGVIEDPSGNQYWGALLSFKVLEFAQ